MGWSTPLDLHFRFVSQLLRIGTVGYRAPQTHATNSTLIVVLVR